MAGKEMNTVNYFKPDLLRIIKGYELYLAILGVTASLFFSMEGWELINQNVLDTYMKAISASGIMVAYAFCAFPFAAVFCEELEHKYIRLALIRGSFRKYVLEKTIVIYITAALAMILGTFLFLMLLRMKGPWTDMGPNLKALEAGSYGFLIEEEKYLSFCMVSSVQLGMLAGVFSVFASLISLYIQNKVMVFILPILLYQILMEFDTGTRYGVFAFRIINNLFGEEWKNTLYLVGISLMLTCICAVGIYRKLRRKM